MHDCVETIFGEEDPELWGSACGCDRTEDHDYDYGAEDSSDDYNY
jgi:hypothetical protein